jgi:ABC-2 type transport system ATP-binding protein
MSDISGAAVTVSGLTKYYDSLLAVDHISFEIGHGEIFGFLGPNGAGKTSTIRMLMNLIRPSEGSAAILGMDTVRDSLAVKAKVGIVPEVSNIFPELSTLNNLTFTGALYGMSHADKIRRAGELIELFGLAEHRQKKAMELSMGLKRRLAIAMSIMHQPKVIFLDEPTSGLDVAGARGIRDTVRELNEEGVTFFLTTHNMDEANQLCRRIAVISRGQLIAVDTPEGLKRAAAESQAVEVAFDRELEPAETEELSCLEDCSQLHPGGGKYRIRTSDPARILQGLYPFMDRRGLKPLSINTLGPSLEDVFVRLTESGKEQGSDR